MPTQKKNPYLSTLAGTGAGVVEALCMQVTWPFPIVRTRLPPHTKIPTPIRVQSLSLASQYQHTSVVTSFRTILQNEGFRGLYKGIVPVLWIAVPRVSLQYWGLSAFLPVFQQLEGTYIPNKTASAFAGACTGMIQATALITPLELLKIRQQTSLSLTTTSQFSLISSIIKHEGPLALWNGLAATAARQAWGLVLKFTCYNELKEVLTRGKKQEEVGGWEYVVAGGGFV
ncbi:hypothetical protein HK097_001607 [Rhizophlyctis rosea]|uniref:Mitochondrial carrier n=1 Tax=Rhizophlyctis rosea TaxID=64517 RepID=A0AAD5S6L6_9FUNG|nr:hypothetical protein HK097_001607 [Rhizophlyctis rosea]